ncbi:MAG: hypothetical protein RRA94_09775, partial [Bacteroidota bacterium]|nr:hypothetical protein [Bacteroidota bacterium]
MILKSVCTTLRSKLTRVIALGLLLGCAACKEEPPQAPSTDDLTLTSFLEEAVVGMDDTLQLMWTANLSSPTDSIILSAICDTGAVDVRQLAVFAGKSGSFSVRADDIGCSRFHFQLRTSETEIVRSSAGIRVMSTGPRQLWFISHWPRAVWETDTLLVRWQSRMISEDEELTLSIHSDGQGNWSPLTRLTASDTSFALPIKNLGRSSLSLRISTAAGDVFDTSPSIDVIPAQSSEALAVLEPRSGDTLVWHRDALVWLPAPGRENAISEIE